MIRETNNDHVHLCVGNNSSEMYKRKILYRPGMSRSFYIEGHIQTKLMLSDLKWAEPVKQYDTFVKLQTAL